jgi:hypothetical protein
VERDDDPDVETHRLPRCAECRRVWTNIRERGWQTHLVDDEPPLFYRPACAAREFGGN